MSRGQQKTCEMMSCAMKCFEKQRPFQKGPVHSQQVCVARHPVRKMCFAPWLSTAPLSYADTTGVAGGRCACFEPWLSTASLPYPDTAGVAGGRYACFEPWLSIAPLSYTNAPGASGGAGTTLEPIILKPPQWPMLLESHWGQRILKLPMVSWTSFR